MNLGLVRQRHIQYVFFFCAIALILQAAYLQLIDDDFRKRADATTIENLRVYPPRGLILDRRGRLIVNNEATYDLMVIYNQVKQKAMDIPKFCQLLNITAEQFKQNLTKDWKSGRYSRSVPYVFMKKLNQVRYSRVE